jgi:hypothetical protein
MDFNEIRRLVSARPFEPLVFYLDNGDKHFVKHPEIIVTDVMVITVNDKGKPVYIAPEAISAIRPARRATRRPTTRVKSRR